MTKQDLEQYVAEKAKMSKKDAKTAVNAVFEGIQESLAKGEKVSVLGFGTFEVRQRKERTVRSVRTGETMTVPASSVPAFKPSKVLRDEVSR